MNEEAGRRSGVERNRQTVIAAFGWIDKILTLALGASVIVLSTYFLDADQIKVFDITFRREQFWVAALGLTLSHLYASWVAIGACKRLFVSSKVTDRQETYDRVTGAGGIFVCGMIPRSAAESHQLFRKMSLSDPTTWLSLATLIAVFLALAPLSQATSYPSLRSAFAVAICLLNWRMAANWSAALSDMSVSKGEAYYLKAVTRGAVNTGSGTGFGDIGAMLWLLTLIIPAAAITPLWFISPFGTGWLFRNVSILLTMVALVGFFDVEGRGSERDGVPVTASRSALAGKVALVGVIVVASILYDFR